MLATTATANERVTSDVAAQLGDDTVTLRGSLARASLRLAVVPGLTPLERYAWVADALTELPGSGIIYVLTVKESERVAGFLTSLGHDVAAYSGQTQNREELEDRLRATRSRRWWPPRRWAWATTSQIWPSACTSGRRPRRWPTTSRSVGPGRALDDATAVLVPSEADEKIWDYFATAGIPVEGQVEQILDVLADEPQSVPALENATGIRRGRLETVLKILAVDDAVTRQGSGWVSTGKGWYFDEAKWAALRKVRATEADLMRRYAHGEGCLMQFLQLALDDPDPSPCGRCSVCDGQLPAPGLRPSAPTIEAARRYFRGQDVLVEPRKMWVSGLPGKKGKIGFLGEGRAMAYADDPAWSGVLADLWRQDGEAPPEVLEAVVEVLKRWSKTWQRPTAVVAMPSRRYPLLVASVAAHVARIGRLPLVEALAVSGPPPTEDAASSVRARDLLARTSLIPGVELQGPVLLVDDKIRTRWTVTVAGSLLAEAGASTVLPLALHQLP